MAAMEPPPAAEPELVLFFGSSSFQDPDIVEVSPSACTSSPPKPKRSQVVPHVVIELVGDDDGVVSIGESTSDYKNKEAVRNDKSCPKQPKDHEDHYFSRPDLLKAIPSTKKPSKDWSKRIQHEWKVLEKDLPEMIYVRIYEGRMDILRAVIIGPPGTPYHDGLFFFDTYFPPNYPQTPPMVHYHSGGLRLNPNLYACGKVLISIQALVLNTKPYFNEPGYAQTANTDHGEKESLMYNENTFLLSCKTMLYSLRKPPTHFDDFVAGHFRNRGHMILVACKAYMGGAQVGCVVGEGVHDVSKGDKSCSPAFKSSLEKLFEDLLMEFAVKGVDCVEFLPQKAKVGIANTADTTL